MELRGAVALITGGAQGLGYAIATHLSAQGATVVVADANADALARLPPHFDGRLMDVTNAEQVRGVVGEIVEAHGQLNILVNNAGVIFSEPMVNIMNPAGMMHDLGRFRAALAVNLESVFIVTSAFVEPLVRRRAGGVIINISSISARGNEGQTAYAAAKAGVNAMTVTWSKELARFGIRCNAVAPGFIGTESTRRALKEPVLKHIEGNTPLRRLGDPVEVAQAVAALVQNDFINGAILDVNGGLTI